MRKDIVRIILLLVGLYMVSVLARNLWLLYQAGERVKEAGENLEEVKEEEGELEIRLEEVKSDDFKEKEVRDKLNMQKEGELVVVLPKGVDGLMVEDEDGGGETSNLEKWWMVLFGED